MNDNDPVIIWANELQAERELYNAEILNSRQFQDAMNYLQSITSHFLVAETYVRLSGPPVRCWRGLSFIPIAPHLVEAALAVTSCAKEGMQNAARRELRFLLEAAVKLSARDTHNGSATFEERLSGLGDRAKRFEDYVAELQYFEEFEGPEEANAEALSLYSELSAYVHASVPQFERAMARSRKGEPPGMETVATLNRFNKLAFRVYDLALVRIFYGLGVSMAGDIFTTTLDDEPDWRFHKGKFVGRMSLCFDYKHERRSRREDT
jgi:hypothetical protein